MAVHIIPRIKRVLDQLFLLFDLFLTMYMHDTSNRGSFYFLFFLEILTVGVCKKRDGSLRESAAAEFSSETCS